MVLEQFIDRKIVARHAIFVFLLSACYVFVSYFVQKFFFPGNSLAIVLLLTILLVPSLHHLTVVEEKLERREVSHFWKRHKTIIKCYLGTFLGVLAGFTVLGFFDQSTLDYQFSNLLEQDLRPQAIVSFTQNEYSPSVHTALAVFSHNTRYLIVGFLLSIFYGAGAIFLITYNASFFAAFIVKIFSLWANNATHLSAVFLSHMLPESIGFILTAMAGASVSRAIVHEKLSGTAFRNVLKNDFFLLVIGLLFVLLAAFIETYFSAPVFHALVQA